MNASHQPPPAGEREQPAAEHARDQGRHDQGVDQADGEAGGAGVEDAALDVVGRRVERRVDDDQGEDRQDHVDGPAAPLERGEDGHDRDPEEQPEDDHGGLLVLRLAEDRRRDRHLERRGERRALGQHLLLHEVADLLLGRAPSRRGGPGRRQPLLGRELGLLLRRDLGGAGTGVRRRVGLEDRRVRRARGRIRLVGRRRIRLGRRRRSGPAGSDGASGPGGRSCAAATPQASRPAAIITSSVRIHEGRIDPRLRIIGASYDRSADRLILSRLSRADPLRPVTRPASRSAAPA